MRRALLALGAVAWTGCSGRCDHYWWEPFLEIGVGTSDFIYTPPHTEVAPEFGPERYFNIALQAWAIDPEPLQVRLEARVNDTVYAINEHQTAMECRRRSYVVGGLRLYLDPAQLPPQTASSTEERASEERDVERFDTGYGYVGREGDVIIHAAVTDGAGNTHTAQTPWFVYR